MATGDTVRRLDPGRSTRKPREAARYDWRNTLTRPYLHDYRLRERSTVLDTLKVIRDVDPNGSMAVTNVLRLANSGHETNVWTDAVDADGNPVPHPRGKAIVDEYAARVGAEYGGGMDNLIDVLLLTQFTQGAMALEVEPNESLTGVVDFWPVDPARITFVRDEETQALVPHVRANGQLRALNTEQFRYVPFDPAVEEPYGRSPMLSVIGTVFFETQLMRDLEAVVHNQGMGRYDVKVLEDAVIHAAQESGVTDPDEIAEYKDRYLNEIGEYLSGLEPDDAYIHWDAVEVAGAQSGEMSLDLKVLIDWLRSRIANALKQMPILLGFNEGSTTTHATVQWRIFAGTLESLQRRIKRLLEWAYTLTLELHGIRARVEVEFNEPSATDRQADEQADTMRANRYAMYRREGWIDNDEAAQEVVGHKAVGEPEPAPVPTPADDPDAGRGVRRRLARRMTQSRAANWDGEADLRDRVSARFAELRRIFPALSVAEAAEAVKGALGDIEEEIRAWQESSPARAWSADLTDVIDGAYKLSFPVGAQDALDELGARVTFKLRSREVIDYLREYAGERVAGIDTVTRRQLAKVASEGVAEGLTRFEIAERLELNIAGMSEDRALLIAQAETGQAYSIGSFEAYRRSGVTGKSWKTSGDDLVTQGCKENGEKGTIGLDEEFPSGHLHPLRTPRCRCTLVPQVSEDWTPDETWDGS